jgi:tRNA pseudouridine32 synthase/23S rRNA pseudouridine746 synthase
MTLSQSLAPPAVTVVYEDAHLIVLDKPADLLSVPGRGPERADCLSARAQRIWSDALIVHRLDMATSGLLVMARGMEAQRQLSAAFANRHTHKRYEAVVWGHLPSSGNGVSDDNWQTIDQPLIVDWPNRPRSMVCPIHGKPSVTRWQVLAHHLHSDSNTPMTRLALQPITGRSHQLRVHLQFIGHPIVGDGLYAPAAAQMAAPRLLLHACQLGLPHPATGQWCEWSSPVPF